MDNTESKAIVISGGGARGAWGVGIAKALTQHEGNDYDCLVGTSTGSLMGPLVLTKQFEKLEDAYTSVTQKSIFNVNPFNKKGKVAFWNFIWRSICKKKTLGESKNLLKLIPQFLTKSDFESLSAQGKEFVATVTSITNNEVAFKSTKETSYQDMIEWIWASGNTGVFMSLLHKDGQQWADGGIKEFLPISYAIEQGAKHIDVIVHRPRKFLKQGWKQEKGVLDLLLRVIDILTADVGEDDIENSKLRADIDSEIHLNFYFMTEELLDRVPNSLVFDKAVMKDILNIGYNSVVDGTVDKLCYSVDKSGVMKRMS